MKSHYLFTGIMPISEKEKYFVKFLQTSSNLLIAIFGDRSDFFVCYLRLTFMDTTFFVRMRFMTSSCVHDEMEYPFMRTISSPTSKTEGRTKSNCELIILKVFEIGYNLEIISMQRFDNVDSLVHSEFQVMSRSHFPVFVLNLYQTPKDQK